MWEIKLTIKHNRVRINILLNKTVVLSESNLAIHVGDDHSKCELYMGNHYEKGFTSHMWEFIESLYKEFILYRKYGDKDDLDLDTLGTGDNDGSNTKEIINRYYCDALIPMTFSEELVDNVISEVDKMCKSINNSSHHKYKKYFFV